MRKILLVDDEKELVDLMSKRIQRAGYEVKVSYNGQEGLETAMEFQPDVIMTDIAMPIMDGCSLYRELKNNKELNRIPVIFASAYGNMENELRQQGVREFLMKPFTISVVLQAIDKCFASSPT